MKISIMLFSILISMKAFGWGAPNLASEDVRQKTYSLETKLDKKKAYTKLNIWTAKTFVNSNESIKLKDPDSGVIVAKGNLSCEALKLGNGYGQDQRVEMTLELSIEDKKVEVKVSDLLGRSLEAYDDKSRPSTKEEAEKAFKECIDPFIEKIKKELT